MKIKLVPKGTAKKPVSGYLKKKQAPKKTRGSRYA